MTQEKSHRFFKITKDQRLNIFISFIFNRLQTVGCVEEGEKAMRNRLKQVAKKFRSEEVFSGFAIQDVGGYVRLALNSAQ